MNVKIRVLQYDPDQEQLVCQQCLIHPNEIWDIAPSPASEELLITVWSKGGWRGGKGAGTCMIAQACFLTSMRGWGGHGRCSAHMM
jgi:hypothetical protein